MANPPLRAFVAHSFDNTRRVLSVSEFRSAVREAIEHVSSRAFADLAGQRFAIDPFFEDATSGKLLPVQVRSHLEDADLVVIDITGVSPNVMYELGFSHARGVPLVIVGSEPHGDNIPRDIGDLVIGWYRDADQLRHHLQERLGKILPMLASDGPQTRELRERCFWFAKDVAEVQIVCAPEPEMSRFAQSDAEDYLFVDGLEDRDGLMEVAMFLSRARPRARIVRHSSGSVTPDVLGSNLVVLGGPMNNHVTRDLMQALDLPVRYDLNAETAHFGRGGERAELRLERAESGLITRDVGYFGRFANPFNRGHHIVLCQGFHTFGTLAATLLLGDESQAVANRRWLSGQVPNGGLDELESLQAFFSVEVLASRRVVVPALQQAHVLFC